MSIKLNGSTAGSVSLDAPASTTGSNDIAFKLPIADGSANQVIKTDGSGNLGFISSPNWVHTAETALNGNSVVVENGVPDGASHIRYLLRYVSVSGASSSAQPFIQVELNNNGTIKNSNWLGASTTTRNGSAQVQGSTDRTDGLTLWHGYTHGGNTLFGVVDIYRIGTSGSDGTNYYVNFQGLGNSASTGYDATHSGQAYFELGTNSTDYVSGLRLSTGSSSVTFDNGYVQQSYLLS